VFLITISSPRNNFALDENATHSVLIAGAIPYLLEAEAVETEPGEWQLRLAYPELPGCMAEGSVVRETGNMYQEDAVEIFLEKGPEMLDFFERDRRRPSSSLTRRAGNQHQLT
jgi:small ligand-binding sensory domain FIST